MSSENTGSTGLYDFLSWLEANRKAVAIGLAVLVALGFGIAIVQRNAERTATEADGALLNLRAYDRGTASLRPSDAADFLRVAADYPGTPAAARARLLAATAYYQGNEFDKAKTEYDRFLADYPSHPSAESAFFGAAASLEAAGNLEAALSAFQALPTRFPQPVMEGQAKLAIARIYEAQAKLDLALQAYDELTRGGTMSAVLMEAFSRRERLLGKHPELVKPAAPEFTTNVVPGAVTPPAASDGAAAPAPAPVPAQP